MDGQLLAAAVDGGIPIVGGIIGTVVGFRAAKKPIASVSRGVALRGRLTRSLRVLGPIVVLSGVLTVVRGRTEDWAWRSYTPPNARFTVEFPGAPKAAAYEQETPVGPLTIHRFSTTKLAGAQDFGVSYRTYSPAMQNGGFVPTHDEAAVGLASAKGNTLVSKEDVVVSGLVGREVVMDVGSSHRIRARLVIVGDTLYNIMVTVPKDWTDPDPTRTERFLSSLHVQAR